MMAGRHALENAARVASSDPSATSASEKPFVLTLCSVAALVPLPQPRGQLTRFTFFFSRNPEEGGKGYRLHMGYFATRSEGEKWLGILRGMYPNASVTEVPAATTGELLSDTQVLRILEQHGQ